MVDGQSQYSYPDDFLKLEAIEIKDNAGNWIRLQEVDQNDPEMLRTISDFQETSGVPRFYDPRGDGIHLNPAPATGSVTLTNGGKLHYTREIDPFTSADTTQQPGFAENFHRILSLGMSYDWLIVNGPQDKAMSALQQYEQLRKQLREFYASQNQDSRTSFRPALSTRNYV